MELFWIFIPISKKKKGALQQLTELPEKHLCLFLFRSGRVFAVVAAIRSFGFCEGFSFVCLLLLLLFR